MALFLLIAKILVVALFLAMFLRGNRLVWGIGLLTVTSAILLDTFLNTFGRDEMIDELGFFYYVMAGGVFAGAAAWLFGLLRPHAFASAVASDVPDRSGLALPPMPPASADEGEVVAFDRKMMLETIRFQLGPDDVLDLLFDLGLNENDLSVLSHDTNQIIVGLIDTAERGGQTGALALAVERILKPVPADRLPRLEKLGPDSPPTVLRHFLLANYSLTDLSEMAARLGIDWEVIPGPGKKAKVRNFLLYLYRRNRLGELIDLLQHRADEDAAV
jgi:hypothetical protein